MLKRYCIVLLCVIVCEHIIESARTSFRISKPNRRVVVPAYITVPNVSLEQCMEACLYRQKCKGINYSKRDKCCEVLSYDGEGSTIMAISFVNIDRIDMVETEMVNVSCSSCTDGICDPVSGTCHVKECSPMLIGNAGMLGNMVVKGSKVKANCKKHYALTNGVDTIVCQPNGTWSSLPICLWDCGKPNTGLVKATLSPGGTTNGTVRTFTCYNGYFISGNKAETTQNITCHLGGTWDQRPRCVKDCGHPANASSRYASKLGGTNITDRAARTYTCLPDHVVFKIEGYTQGETVYSGKITNKMNKTIKCDGYYPKWRWKMFMCIKECTGSRNTSGVATVDYQLDGDNVTATFNCSLGYTVHDGSTPLGLDSFVTVCNEEMGAWTNLTMECGKETINESKGVSNDVMTNNWISNISTTVSFLNETNELKRD